MRVALYARTSTSDKDQNPETQLMSLRDYCEINKWKIVGEYVDQASARDLYHRTEWRRLLDDAAKRKFNAVLVFKLDRAFRSVKQMHDALSAWEMVGVSFLSRQEGFDTNTAIGRLMMNQLAAFAEFELELIRDRVKAGMDRARRQGKKFGRPSVTSKRGFKRRFGAVSELVKQEELTRTEAAKELGIGYATFKRLIDEGYGQE